MTTITTHRGSTRFRELGGTSSTRVTLVRLGGLPAIAILAARTRSAAELAKTTPAQRLLLAHVAFEHGALWVEHDADGTLTRAATAIPAGRHTISRSVLNEILRVFQQPAVDAVIPDPFAAVLRRWTLLRSLGGLPTPVDRLLLRYLGGPKKVVVHLRGSTS